MEDLKNLVMGVLVWCVIVPLACVAAIFLKAYQELELPWRLR